VPATMHPGAPHDDWTWHRTLALMKPGEATDAVAARMRAVTRAFEEKRLGAATEAMPRQAIDEVLNLKVVLEPAASGASDLRSETRRPLAILAVLAALVLLVACANVANLMTARAAARAREMALRVSIGGGRWRLVQMVLVESAWVAALSTVIGVVFAWWSGPLVVGMINPPDNPARIALAADWRVLGFTLALMLAVTLLFGVGPAVRASAVKPAIALRGGEDPHSRRRLMQGLIGAQVAFSVVVVFVAGLFVATFERLSRQRTGFSAERLLVLETAARQAQPMERWNQVVEHLRRLGGVESAALADGTLLGSLGWNNLVSIDGAPPNGVTVYMLSVAPGWLGAMKIPLLGGRDFLPGDLYPGRALVNEAFARAYLNGRNPVGRQFEIVFSGNTRLRFETVGLVGDVKYRSMREPMLPQVYVPMRSVHANGAPGERDRSTLLVRTVSPNPLALAQYLRQEVRVARPEFRVSNIRTQVEINAAQTVRERLLAMLAVFFATVALLLAGIGLYGVLNYSVLQRRREIAIRMAIGAKAGHVARQVTVEVFAVVLAGAAAGIGLGILSGRYVETLLYEVKTTDLAALMLPSLATLAAAFMAALPAVVRAVRIDPAAVLRGE